MLKTAWTSFFKQLTCRNCGGGDRGRVALYRPFGEFNRAKIVLSPVWCSRPTTGVPLAHATMNFVGLDLTTSDRWIRKQQQHNKLKPKYNVTCHWLVILDLEQD
ncbi:hypothetical protein TNCV_4432791 [Trichonephila clavipes]|nr:hypothetical protein TNCV_4432791 [Trichonephila clavipes]